MKATFKELLAGYPVVIEQAVLWGEMDAYRHVNNVAYIRYLENGRVEYMRRIGWPDVEKETGVGPILASLHCRFRRPLTYPDTITIGTRLGTLGEDRFTVRQIIVSHRLGAVAAEGDGTVVTYHHTEHRKAPMPESMRRRILELEGMADQA
jgi:acyl-CoA thioester hydrolase